MMRNPTIKRISAALAAGLLMFTSVLMPTQAAFAAPGDANNKGTPQPVWCQLTGKVWTAQIGVSGGNQNRYPLTELPVGHSPEIYVGASSQVYAPNSSDPVLKGQLDAYCAQQYVLEIPAAPAINDPCGVGNATWVKPADTDILQWTIVNGSLMVTIIADGYEFTDGTRSHNYGIAMDSGELCDVVIELPTPQQNDPCGPGNASWATQSDTDAIDWELTVGGHLTATAKSGYVFSDGSTFHDYGVATDSGNYCVVPVPPAPHVVDPCNVDGDNASWVKPADDGMFSWSINSEGHLIVTALGDNSFENNVKTHDYGVAPDSGIICATPVRAAISDTCGVKNDTHTIPSTRGIEYLVNGQVVTAGTYPVTDAATLTFTARVVAGYEMVGSLDYTYTFTNEACAPAAEVMVESACTSYGTSVEMTIKNTTDSSQRYWVVVRQADGMEVISQSVIVESGETVASSQLILQVDGDYSVSVYSYNGTEVGDTLFTQGISANCAVAMPNIFKRNQGGATLSGGVFSVMVCNDAFDTEDGCMTISTGVNGFDVDGSWFKDNFGQLWGETTVTVTETTAPTGCEAAGPWSFAWEIDDQGIGMWDTTDSTAEFNLTNNCKTPGKGSYTPIATTNTVAKTAVLADTGDNENALLIIAGAMILAAVALVVSPRIRRTISN